MQERFVEAVEIYLSTVSLLQIQLGLLSNPSLVQYYHHSPNLKTADTLLTLLVVYTNLLYCYQQTDDLIQMRFALDEVNYLVDNFMQGSHEARRIVSRPNEVWGKLYQDKYEGIKRMRKVMVTGFKNRWGAGGTSAADELTGAVGKGDWEEDDVLAKEERDFRAKDIMKKGIMQDLYDKHYIDQKSPDWVQGRDLQGKPVLEGSLAQKAHQVAW